MISYKWWPRPAEYPKTWQAMRDFTELRNEETPDQLWLVEHAPVYTLGQAGRPEHILDSGAIPVVHCDRGGQVTYHGPGQIVLYCLIDLRRLGIHIKQYVALLEQVVIKTLRELGVVGVCRKAGAPGVYVAMPGGDANDTELAKIAALGIKIRKGCAYHGLALNVDMDLSPFLGINPCGYEGLRTVDLNACGVDVSIESVGELLVANIDHALRQLDARSAATA